jgi:hypothetical protein
MKLMLHKIFAILKKPYGSKMSLFLSFFNLTKLIIKVLDAFDEFLSNSNSGLLRKGFILIVLYINSPPYKLIIL